MNREETIKALQNIGAKLAKEYGCMNVVIGEDRQKGIWGENFTKFLENNYGECTKTITWYKDEKSEEKVQFRFRFSHPCLSLRRCGGVFAEIELNDYDYETKSYTGDFKFDQCVIWKQEGIKLFNRLFEEWCLIKETPEMLNIASNNIM